jgi:acetylornithine deacetylase/succinyl-diaminopimelate desuccinylase-like protein
VLAASPVPADKLLRLLRVLCAQSSSSGHHDALAAMASLLAQQLRQLDMAVQIVPTAAAPLVLASRYVVGAPTLVLYHHYDCPPAGPWRAWSHEPFELAERDGLLYGRGVAAGKGPLAAHLAALATLVEADSTWPCSVVMVIEGAALSCSPGLAEALAAHSSGPAVCVLASAGELDTRGKPFVYRGSKGSLRVRLTVHGSEYPLAPGAAATMPNPLWRLTWALAEIKGDNEDIRIPEFYDAVEGPSRADNLLLREVRLAEEDRLRSWQSRAFLFDLSGAALTRAEVTLPTCNLSAIFCETGDTGAVPAAASALLDFQLVPAQQPQHILAMLREHLIARGFADVGVDALPGGYSAIHSPADHPLVTRLAALASQHEPLTVLPAGPFALPLQPLAAHFDAPVAALGVGATAAAVYGPDEHIELAILLDHGATLLRLMADLTHQDAYATIAQR